MPSATRTPGQLPIDLLCRHHILDGFDCGAPAQNASLATRIGTFFDPGDLVILVAHDHGRIRGFISVCDVEMSLDENPEGAGELCFFLAGWGVDTRWSGGSVASDLIARAYELRRMRKHKRYAATLATSAFNPEFEARLRRLKFRRVPGTDSLWYRRPRT